MSVNMSVKKSPVSRVLAVDDSWLVRTLLKGVLEAGGYEVLLASSGREALDIACRIKPDCVLLDLLMPEMSGFEVLETMRDNGPAIPVIVITADIQDASRNKCMEVGAFGFINKPFNVPELLGVVREAVAKNEIEQ